MEPLSLAAVAVGLLVPYFKQAAGKLAERVGEGIADAALPKVKALYERVRSKLAPDSYQSALLGGVEAEPDDANRQEILKAELGKILADDRKFAEDVMRLVDEAEKSGAVRIAATNSGVVAGRDANLSGRYVAGRDLKIGDAADDEH